MTIQLWQFLGLFARWIGTALVTALLFATVEMYRAKDNFTSAQKAAFNAIAVILTLILGLNFFVRFQPRLWINMHRLIPLTRRPLKS